METYSSHLAELNVICMGCASSEAFWDGGQTMQQQINAFILGPSWEVPTAPKIAVLLQIHLLLWTANLSYFSSGFKSVSCSELGSTISVILTSSLEQAQAPTRWVFLNYSGPGSDPSAFMRVKRSLNFTYWTLLKESNAFKRDGSR